MENAEHAIYLILSYSGSLPSRLIRKMTGDPYSHCSVSTDASLGVMYSFGRRRMNNPLNGGFVTEKPGTGIYEKFPDTICCVFRCDLSEQGYEAVENYLASMLMHREMWGYSFLGVFLAKFGITCSRKNRMYCSEFARRVLELSGTNLNALPSVCRPCDFLKLGQLLPVYTGRLNDYSEQNIK